MNVALSPASAGFRPSPRIDAIGVSEILRITAEAAALQRSGQPMIILGAGEPDYDTPDNVKAAAMRAIKAGATKYTALDGSAEMKEAVRRKFARENGLRFEQDQVTCSAGAKQILFNAFMASLASGDEVVIPAPFWTSYADIVTICGGVPVVVACGEAAGFRLQPEQLEAAITPRTKWLMLNSPSNPSGATYSGSELAGLAAVLRRHPHVWILSDDIYEHILYNGLHFATIAAVAPDLGDRTLTVNGVSKAYAMTGWRIGYGAGQAALIKAMAVVQSQSTSCPCSVSQAAAIEALDGPQAIIAERRASFQRRRDLVVDGLNAVEGITCRKPEGAFYTFASCMGLLGRRRPDGSVLQSDRDFARYLLSAGVAVVPGSCFGLDGFFRVSYATSDEALAAALARIKQACLVLSPVNEHSHAGW